MHPAVNPDRFGLGKGVDTGGGRHTEVPLAPGWGLVGGRHTEVTHTEVPNARREPSLHPQAISWPLSLPNPYAPERLNCAGKEASGYIFFGSFRARCRRNETS